MFAIRCEPLAAVGEMSIEDMETLWRQSRELGATDVQVVEEGSLRCVYVDRICQPLAAALTGLGLPPGTSFEQYRESVIEQYHTYLASSGLTGPELVVEQVGEDVCVSSDEGVLGGGNTLLWVVGGVAVILGAYLMFK